MENIKEKRLKKELTQIEVAKHCNVSLTSYRLWESGVQRPTPENMKKLKNILGE